MSTKWTKQQEQAISERNKNLLVSAAAGSGKTAVLVERIVTLMIEQRVPIDALLVVTFTNAAAGEMKERIQKKLHEKRKELLQSESRYENKDLIEFITTQIQNIPGATISTLHSFCIDVLRDNFQLAGLDPGFRLANESLGAILSATALDNIMEQKYIQAEPSFTKLVDSYGGNKDDGNLIDMVKNIDRFIQSQPNPQEWLQNHAAFYDAFNRIKTNDEAIVHLLSLPMGQLYLKNSVESIEVAIRDLKKAKEYALKYNPPMPSIVNIEDDLEQIERIKEQIAKGDTFDSLKNLVDVNFSRYKSPGKNQKENYDEQELLEVKNLRDEAKARIKLEADNFENFFTDTFLQDMQYLSSAVHSLVELVLDYKEEYHRIKQENAVVDFSDLEHLTLQVLKEDEIQEALQNKFQYIFFDEYQDTNLVQETIIERIKREDNLFFVGDVKQSIYRFRLADPTIFNRRYADYKNGKNAQKIDLAQNFRSRKEILDFCNLIFENIMSEKYGEVDYSDVNHQLKAGKEFEPYVDNIELAIIEKSKNEYHLVENKETKGKNTKKVLVEDAEEDIDAITLQAMYIANKIHDLTNAGVEYKDIAILLRSPKGKTKVFEDVLGEQGIPIYIDYKTSNYDSIEIRSMIEYLKIIDNRNQDEALLAAMSSIFGNFENEEFLQIREKYQDFEFHVAVKKYEKDITDDLSNKIEAFYHRLEEDTVMERMMDLGDFIWNIAEKRGLNTYISALESGEQRVHNIKSLVEKAREYEHTEPKGLFGFLRHLDAFLKEKVEDASTPTIIESENVVSLMSIHKSKGLEFKVVFLCNLEKRINEMDLRQNVILHNDLGIGIKYINSDLGIKDDNMVLSMIKDQKQIEGISEEIRILYVAMTRAIDRLYLVGSVKDTEKFAQKVAKSSIQSNIPKQKSFLEWIANVLIREQKGKELRNYTQIDPSINEIDAKYQVQLLNEEDITRHAAENIKERETRKNLQSILQERAESQAEGADAPVLHLLNQYNQFEYPDEGETRQRVKIGVTELVKGYKTKELDESVEPGILKRPLFSKQSTEFKAHEIGTIIHFVMENIPLKTYSLEELGAEIETMVDKELLTKEESKVIPKERIIGFFESNLGKRMLQSERVQRETNFLMKEENYLVEGIIDCYFEEEDEIILLDYKTDVQMNPKIHEPQLLMYKRAIEEMEDKKVRESYIYWIAHDTFSKI